jgi:hypothetical protein
MTLLPLRIPSIQEYTEHKKAAFSNLVREAFSSAMAGDAGAAGDEARSMGIGGRITGGTGVGELASLNEVMDSFLSASGACAHVL